MDRTLLDHGDLEEQRAVSRNAEHGHTDSRLSQLNLSLFSAANQGDEVLLGLLLKQGADPNWIDPYGKSALRCAAANGHEGVTARLLKEGADVNAKDDDGTSALHSAAWNGHLDVVRLLILHGADVTASEKLLGGSPLHWAASYGYVEVARLLLKHGASTKAVDNRGLTFVDLASSQLHRQFLELCRETDERRAQEDEQEQQHLMIKLELAQVKLELQRQQQQHENAQAALLDEVAGLKSQLQTQTEQLQKILESLGET